MKVYNLCCATGHRFEGWFSSEQDFTSQANERRIECPVCESADISRLPSAPRLNLSAGGKSEDRNAALVNAQAAMMEMLRKVVAQTEDVGERFVEEARRIHYQEAPERAIRGVASVAECEALADEGIDVLPLPIPAALKQPLQ
ncbi:DUF1178 family protein [Noviherbaspirillum aerium]|uniref:DUF1178 family protein n=1 Tax=Noviherbaspirillum aerium TaxID=2588497 RepID=UPI00124EFAE1|nr:DUF1178 family protein [Noviherbaspirillum aerium]